MIRHAQGSENISVQVLGVIHEGSEQVLVALPIALKGGRGIMERALEQRGAATVERMRQREGRMCPGESVLLERDVSEERRRKTQRVDGRADVVNKAGQSQCG